jgi:CheY-like chemotaxis protein
MQTRSEDEANKRLKSLQMPQRGYILIVDDEPMIADTLRMELNGRPDLDIPVITANSGQEALAIIREEMAYGNYPAVAIVDYLMHPMKGSELLEAIEHISPATKKIMLTGQADLMAVKQVMSTVRLYRYMEKPWRSMDMDLTISEALRLYDDELRIRSEYSNASKGNGMQYTLQPIEQEIPSKHSDMERSLSYARTIQQCFIPELHTGMSEMLGLHVMDRPLAEVSGDFRWYRQIGDDLYIALGDCVGHGLAGAIIAVLATDILSNTLSNATSPQQDTCSTVRTVMSQLKARLVREGGASDHVGLELTLLRIDLKDKIMHWSSLNGYLITIDPEGTTNILSKSRGISSTGPHGQEGCHFGSMDVAGHQVLMFTDGITDQFGGPLNKRMRLDGLLRMVEQGNVFLGNGECRIDSAFDQWRGNNDQVDDCLWVSFRLP